MTEETEQSNIWKHWAIEDSLKNTDTYEILYNNSANIEFECEKDLCNFIKYCEYMMFSNSDLSHPLSLDGKPSLDNPQTPTLLRRSGVLTIPEEECREYFRRLYKYVDMIYADMMFEKKYN